MEDIQLLLREKYGGKRTPAFLRDVARLKRGEHLDYVIGWKPFLNCKIDLRYRPLIPRAETEHWAENAIADIRTVSFPGALPHIPPAGGTWAPTRLRKTHSSNITCLDMFAGSGCIGIAILKHITKVHITFSDNDKKFLKQIVLNAKLNHIAKSRYSIVLSNIFSNVRGTYDYIFANPPYLAESRKSKIQKSVLEQEPHSALFGGRDGLKYIRLFLSRAKEFLNPHGVIFLEFDSFQKKEIENLLKKFGYSKWQFHKDQFNRWRFVKILNPV